MHTVGRAAALAGISKRYMEMRIDQGTGPGVTRIGRRVLIRDDRLRAWIDQQTEEGTDVRSDRDEQTDAALQVLAAVKANVIDGDPEAMLRRLRGSSSEVSLRLAEATNLIAHMCKASGQPEVTLAALVETVTAASTG